ncbi:hypothetical protein IWX49DRAFT_167783 [Phyllosticta citricarpa]|uniref:Histone transcription regulator 3 homolog n=1 Tax=Phyllosticta citricarpa TaxID=55181 RepID=A0ABR1MNW3_9PEZI
MSSFKALNIESDIESDDEIDDTKEIQIEEALKLYQTALKYHSEGPRSFAQAAEAYKALFESEIFNYTESLSEFRRSALHGDPDFDLLFQEDFDAGPVQTAGGADSAPNTLPQILHLSYKNHGQFLLEALHHELGTSQLSSSTHAPLQFFAEALDKDDTDLDLWSRAASVAALAGSSRIARFCLEAVLEGDDEGLDSIMRLPGLEEGFAGQQLRELVEKLKDQLSLALAPLSDLRRKRLSTAIKKRLAPLTFAPLPAEVQLRKKLQDAFDSPPFQVTLTPISATWAHVGDAILTEYIQGLQQRSEKGPGALVALKLPRVSAHEPGAIDMEVHHGPGAEPESKPDHQKDVGQDTREQPRTNAREDGDSEMKDAEDDTQTSKPEAAANGDGAAIDQSERPGGPSRKRSTDSAGLAETADGGRVRSKRIRARESVGDGALGTVPDTSHQLYESGFKTVFEEADDWTFQMINEILAKLGIKSLGSSKKLRDVLRNQGEPAGSRNTKLETAAKDLYLILQTCTPQAATVLTSGDSVDLLGGASREAGLNAFLGYTKSPGSQASSGPLLVDEGLLSWSQRFEIGGPVKELLWSWLQAMMRSRAMSTSENQTNSRSSYLRHQWSEDLKRIVVQAIVNADDLVYQRLLEEATQLNSRLLQAQASGKELELDERETSMIEMVQSVFELHLDVYSLIRHPTSSVDISTQTLQRERLERWVLLARDAIAYRSSCRKISSIDELDFRHLWASIFHLSVSEDTSQDYVVACIEELKTIAGLLDIPVIHLQNNAIMPELSVEAAERELTKINMKDAFMKVFQQDENDPVTVIESLEPILESSCQGKSQQNNQNPGRLEIADSQDNYDSPSQPSDLGNENEQIAAQSRPGPLQAMIQFVSNANVSLRLSLWQRLRQAYEAIDYPPKVVSCYLRSIEILVEDMKSAAYTEDAPEQRSAELLKWLRIIDEIFVKILKSFGMENIFECIDEDHMQSSLNAIAELLWLLNTTNVYEDDLIRAGQLSQPTFEGHPSPLHHTALAKLHEIQVRGWMLQWILLDDAMKSNADLFPTPNEDRFEYLRHLHYDFGIRGFCAASNKLFLRVFKDQLLRWFKDNDIADVETRDRVLCQVLYDLYNLYCFTDPLDKTEHPNEYDPKHDPMDQKAALKLLDFVMYQTRKVSLKDLHKTQLGASIDVVHGHLARTKPAGADDLALNRLKYMSFIKSPIRATDLYRCVKGVGELSTKPIPSKNARIASKGWYFLMGSLALNRFRSQNQKRQAPVPTEDLNIASAFFVQDLEFDSERWETWYLQALSYDYQIDEMVAWSAEKVNRNDPDLIQHQRAAIHCYTMAVATAMRHADSSEKTQDKIAQLFADFGMRIYASSRDPFAMQAFNFKEAETRFYSKFEITREAPFTPLLVSSAWKFAAGLFRRAINRRPDYWLNYYMLGKCLWKLLNVDSRSSNGTSSNNNGSKISTWPDTRYSFEKIVQSSNVTSSVEVVDAFVRAIEELPEKKGSRDAILEPHYKLLSVLHKMVHTQKRTPNQAMEALQATHYARQIPMPLSEDDDISDREEWDDYCLKVLKVIRQADKSNWHHRMTARAARIHYGDPRPEDTFVSAIAAKNEFTQQIYTKTMQLQVWKPEYERLGRHFVYTTRYTTFFIQLLAETNDRAGMEALAKRVRRRNHEFYEHGKLWQNLCQTYLKMLRKAARIPEGHEDAVFKAINHEEWLVWAGKLETWCRKPENKSPVLEVLTEAIELRRLNNNLMKATLIDDLIGDTYALLYQQVLPQLLAESGPAPTSETVQPPSGAAAAPERTNMMSMQNIMNMDGTSDQQGQTPAFQVLNLQSSTQPQPSPAEPPITAAAPKTRLKGVGRRELMRKADAAVTRPVAAPSTTNIPIRATPTPKSAPPAADATAGAAEDATKVKEEPEAEGEAEGEAEAEADGQDEQQEGAQETAEEGTQEETETGTGAAEPSAPASVHDSADDESELSELDEDLD